MGALTDLRLTLLRNGYKPVPVRGIATRGKGAGKAPPLDEWTTVCFAADEATVRAWETDYRSAVNTGLLCGSLIGVDIDILDPAQSAELEKLATVHLGGTPLKRVGRSPKTMLCYRTDTPFRKIATPEMHLPDGSKAQVEVLAEGEQFVGFGLHPETKQPYHWLGDTPKEIPLRAIPAITQSQAVGFVAAAEAALRKAGATTERDRRRQDRDGRATANIGANEAPSFDLVAEALDAIPNTFSYDGWIKVGFALYAALGNSGRKLWEAWSAKSGKNNPAVTADKWPSFASVTSVSAGTIFWLAKEEGWRRPASARAAPKATGRLNGHAKANGAGHDLPPHDPDTGEIHDDAGVPPPSADWRAGLIRSQSTQAPKAILTNACLPLREAPDWAGILWFDTFSQKIFIRGAAPWEEKGAVESQRPWTDYMTSRAAEWLQQQAISVNSALAGEAIQTVAQEQQFHPVMDFLGTCHWDGTHRIDEFLATYFGAESNAYSESVGSRWLISAVARVSSPGCKADHALILEGPQGAYKSSAVQALFTPWFCDDLGGDIGSKDASLQLAGRWCIELAELDSLERSEVARIKAWISRRSDRYRPPYARLPIEQPRQCVFAGTVNRDDYLRDDTGGRRFWPVRCGKIDVNAINRDRTQIWAEANARYHAGDLWWMDTASLIKAAAAQQGERYHPDAWDDLIVPFIQAKTEVSVGEVLRDCISSKVEKWSRLDQMRVAKCLAVQGWTRKKVGPKGNQKWVYVAPQQETLI